MLVNLYKSKTPIAVFSFPLLIGLLALPIFFVENRITPAFFSWQLASVQTILQSDVIHYFVVIILTYIAGNGVNLLVNKYGFYSKNTYLPGVVFVISLFALGQLNFSMLLLSYPFLVFGIAYLFKINRQEPASSHVFMASFMFGAVTCIEPLLAPVILLPWFTLMVFKSFVWREWAILILGIVIPWLYHFALYFVFTGEMDIQKSPLAIINESINFSLTRMILFGFMSLLVIYSSFRFLVILNNQLLVFKKRTRLLFHFIWLTFISFVLGWILFDHAILVLSIPMSVIVAIQMLHSKRELYVNVMLLLWIALVVVNLIF